MHITYLKGNCRTSFKHFSQINKLIMQQLASYGMFLLLAFYFIPLFIFIFFLVLHQCLLAATPEVRSRFNIFLFFRLNIFSNLYYEYYHENPCCCCLITNTLNCLITIIINKKCIMLSNDFGK